MSSGDKDFIDIFFENINPYKDYGVRLVAVVITFLSLFVFGSFIAPLLIKTSVAYLPFSIKMLQTSPLEILFVYFKTGFFFSLFLTAPLFLYQFGKLKYENIKIEDKINLLYAAIILLFIIVLSTFLTCRFVFPFEISVLYGLNFHVAEFSATISSMIATFILSMVFVTFILLLPFLRYLIKQKALCNYATFVSYKKIVMIYTAVLTALMILPVEIIIAIIVFFIFMGLYRILINFSKKRD